MAKIFEQQTIDFETGEIKSISTVKVNSFDERFGFYRTTTGVEWIFDFTANELQFLMLLCHLEDDEHIVRMTPLLKEQILKDANLKITMFKKIIKGLEDKNGITRISKSDIILNPRYFYKGGSKLVKEKILNYDKIREDFEKTHSKLL